MTSSRTPPLVPDRAKQGGMAQEPRQWEWVETSVWTERMLTALGNGVKGGKWFSLIDKVWAPATLAAAWKRVASKRGAAGVDRVSIEKFRAQENRYLDELSEALCESRYRPEPVRRVHIPKGKGKLRPLGIPTVKDRIVQTALKMVLEPIFEVDFLPTSYGFRPGRGCKDALREVDRYLKEGYTWVVDADLKDCFGSIPHEGLLERVGHKVSDGRVLNVIKAYVKQDIQQEMTRWTPQTGTPQGAVISPLLANVYLHPLDVGMRNAGNLMVRYADDFVILCKSEAEAAQALSNLQVWTSDNGLTLHPDKTHVGNCLIKGQGFEFLGYRFEGGRRFVRDKSMKALKDKIRVRTPRNRGDSIKHIIEDLNPTLGGWLQYFQHAHWNTFPGVDGFVRRRLRSLLSKQAKKSLNPHALNTQKRWPNSFFAENGLFSMTKARALARQPRCG